MAVPRRGRWHIIISRLQNDPRREERVLLLADPESHPPVPERSYLGEIADVCRRRVLADVGQQSPPDRPVVHGRIAARSSLRSWRVVKRSLSLPSRRGVYYRAMIVLRYSSVSLIHGKESVCTRLARTSRWRAQRPAARLGAARSARCPDLEGKFVADLGLQKREWRVGAGSAQVGRLTSAPEL